MGLLGLMTSCAFQQEIHFNKDWSGNVKYTIDLSAMKALMDDIEDSEDSEEEEEEEPKSLIEKDDMQSAVESLEKIEGISNAYATEDEENGVYTFGYEFKDIDALNRALQEGDVLSATLPNNDGQVFELKGSQLTYQLPPIVEDSETQDMVLAMGESMEFKLIFTFDRTVKKVKMINSEISVSSNDYNVTWDVDVNEMFQPQKPIGMTITVK